MDKQWGDEEIVWTSRIAKDKWMDMNGYLRINTSKELDWQKGYERINKKDKSHKDILTYPCTYPTYLFGCMDM